MASNSPAKSRDLLAPPEDASARPTATRVWVIGTSQTIHEWDICLRALPDGPHPLGATALPDDALNGDALNELTPDTALTERASLADQQREQADALAADLLAAAGYRFADRVIVSLPACLHALRSAVERRLAAEGVTAHALPPLSEQLAAPASSSATTTTKATKASKATTRDDPGRGEIDYAALIDRHPAPLDRGAIAAVVTGRRVMITGAGGSIGSELARVVAGFQPEALLLAERSENALFEIDQALARRFPNTPRVALLHDVTHERATHALIAEQRPDLILHAAAHKHVPMMEEHPAAAVENNLFGTRSIADAADRNGVARFVMISSDKAVNPSSVMGATKRLAELYIQHLNTRSRTSFAMVRFGNVLGSACSVLPIWSRQIAEGGPITVTHSDMTRYFMTIPEAAGLVLQAAAYTGRSHDANTNTQPTAPCAEDDRDGAVLALAQAFDAAHHHAHDEATPDPDVADADADDSHNRDAEHGGEVFLLDMGQPVRILDMAHRYLDMLGLEPGQDVQIEITGVRPGEKLFEELAYDSEDMRPTPHPSIRLWKTSPPTPALMRQIHQTFDRLRNRSARFGLNEHPWQGATRDAVVAAIRACVPEMVRPALHPEKAAG